MQNQWELEIKKAGADHIHALQKIGRQTFEETFRDTNTPENLDKYLEESFNIRKLSMELHTPNSLFFLGIIQDEIVAYLKVNVLEAQTEFRAPDGFEVERIYVAKAWWGKAVGQQLLDFALNMARERKARYVWLGVWEKNFQAIRFYEKNGFTPFDKHIFMVGNDPQTDVLMNRMINETEYR